MAEVHSTYQWELVENNDNVSLGAPNITYKDGSDNVIENITVKATISNKDNIFAIIAGTYEVTVTGTYTPKQEETDTKSPVTFTCTSTFDKPKLCTKKSGNNTIEIDLHLDKNDNNNKSNLSNIEKTNYELTWAASNFGIQEGLSDNISNNYLHILQKPVLIKSLIIDEKPSIENKYVEGSAIPINEIDNISTIDFHNITINDVDNHDIFSKLSGQNVTIKTNELSIPELTVVELPENENENEQIIICKSKSKNDGITFKISDPDDSPEHFGYIIHIGDDKSAGYNSVWVNRNMLNVIFPGMPADIMSNTETFEYKDGFELNKLTYEEIDVVAPTSINNENFSAEDISKLESGDYAPTYKAVTINESADSVRANNMLLKNIEFVKFGDKVIKLNYEPLTEAQNQSI